MFDRRGNAGTWHRAGTVAAMSQPSGRVGKDDHAFVRVGVADQPRSLPLTGLALRPLRGPYGRGGAPHDARRNAEVDLFLIRLLADASVAPDGEGTEQTKLYGDASAVLWPPPDCAM
jgi:hypothetical protein